MFIVVLDGFFRECYGVYISMLLYHYYGNEFSRFIESLVYMFVLFGKVQLYI